MHIKTMEGLTGAQTNHNLLKVPFRVFKDARRRGDLGVMERAMEYVSDFAGKSQEYQAKAEEGMEEDAKEAKEREKLELEKAIERRREENEELEELEETKEGNPAAKEFTTPDGETAPAPDTLELSPQGKALAQSQPSQQRPGLPALPQHKEPAPPLFPNGDPIPRSAPNPKNQHHSLKPTQRYRSLSFKFPPFLQGCQS